MSYRGLSYDHSKRQWSCDYCLLISEPRFTACLRIDNNRWSSVQKHENIVVQFQTFLINRNEIPVNLEKVRGFQLDSKKDDPSVTIREIRVFRHSNEITCLISTEFNPDQPSSNTARWIRLTVQPRSGKSGNSNIVFLNASGRELSFTSNDDNSSQSSWTLLCQVRRSTNIDLHSILSGETRTRMPDQSPKRPIQPKTTETSHTATIAIDNSATNHLDRSSLKTTRTKKSDTVRMEMKSQFSDSTTPHRYENHMRQVLQRARDLHLGKEDAGQPGFWQPLSGSKGIEVHRHAVNGHPTGIIRGRAIYKPSRGMFSSSLICESGIRILLIKRQFTILPHMMV